MVAVRFIGVDDDGAEVACMVVLELVTVCSGVSFILYHLMNFSAIFNGELH
jgi:hypothetical protein